MISSSFRSSQLTCFGDIAATCIAIAFARSRNSGLRATKSVSLESSTSAPMRPPLWMYASTTPSLVSRSLRFAADESPFSLRIVFAFSKSPLAASSAFFESITPAPVSARRR